MYIVEGNIGAGKSTFLTLIKRTLPQLDVIFEPLTTWHAEEHGQSLLSTFYQDPRRWGYTMETFTMASRVIEHLQHQKKPNALRIIERSIYSGHYCFARNSYAQGFLTPIEWNLYTHWFNTLIPQCKAPEGFIYLRVDPAIAYERIKKRSRSGESTISQEYLEQIHEQHDRFLLKKHDVLPDLAAVPVLVLNCDKEFEADPKLFQEHAAQVKQFMKLV